MQTVTMDWQCTLLERDIHWDEAEVVCREGQWTKRKIKESLTINLEVFLVASVCCCSGQKNSMSDVQFTHFLFPSIHFQRAKN